MQTLWSHCSRIQILLFVWFNHPISVYFYFKFQISIWLKCWQICTPAFKAAASPDEICQGIAQSPTFRKGWVWKIFWWYFTWKLHKMPLDEHKSIFAHQGIDLIYVLHKNRRFCFLLKVLSQYWSDPLSGIDCLLRAWLDQGQSILTETASNVRIAPHTRHSFALVSHWTFLAHCTSLYLIVPYWTVMVSPYLSVHYCISVDRNVPFTSLHHDGPINVKEDGSVAASVTLPCNWMSRWGGEHWALSRTVQ